MTVKEIQAEMLQNYDKYKIDEGYRAEIKGKIARALETWQAEWSSEQLGMSSTSLIEDWLLGHLILLDPSGIL